ncbi:hypothetical protein M885DRAFT_509537 [Pelagophyceae sp. CCMP2097]|nr:hypothetical protein M885DRAFT_509537 [Pelagophyceae sp. CCMP2097]
MRTTALALLCLVGVEGQRGKKKNDRSKNHAGDSAIGGSAAKIVGGAADDPLMRAALRKGGWVCRATLLLHFHSKKRAAALDSQMHDAVDSACQFDLRKISASALSGPQGLNGAGQVVVAVHHNGLGNQLFQHAFGRLLAWSLGAQFTHGCIAKDEAPMDRSKLPMHSGESWDAFGQLFDVPFDASLAPKSCAPLIPVLKQYDANSTLLLAERPADMRRHGRHGLRHALGRILESAGRLKHDVGCVKAIGYFQDYALLRGVSPALKRWLTIKPLKLTIEPADEDVVVHVRLCDGPMHFYKYYSWENYFQHVLSPKRFGVLKPGQVKVVSSCQANRGVVAELIKHVGAVVIMPQLAVEAENKRRSVVADFAYLTRAKRLIVTESTFSWWAAFLNQGGTVHAPGSGVVPVPYAEADYVFHDVVKGAFWGNYSSTSNTLVYAVNVPVTAP